MTDGMLFRETLRDPLLSRFSVIMVGLIFRKNRFVDPLWVSRLMKPTNGAFTLTYCWAS